MNNYIEPYMKISSFKKCDIYLNSSLWEGMPNAVLESLIMKKKVFFLNKIEIFPELKKIFPYQVFILKDNFSFNKNSLFSSKNYNLKKINVFRIENTSSKFEGILK